MKKLKLIICAVGLSFAIPAMAQPQAGDWEFTLGGSGTADNEFETGGFVLNGSVGYFLNPNFEVGLRQGVGFAGFSEASEEWSGSTRVAADWHFLLGKFVPFIGANIGIDYNEHDNSWNLAPEVGFKYYVHEKTFLFALGEYRWFWDKISDVDNNADDGRFALTVGIGFNLGGHR
jgi:hypothetical protein